MMSKNLGGSGPGMMGKSLRVQDLAKRAKYDDHERHTRTSQLPEMVPVWVLFGGGY